MLRSHKLILHVTVCPLKRLRESVLYHFGL